MNVRRLDFHGAGPGGASGAGGGTVETREQDVGVFMAENLPKVRPPVLAAESVEVVFTPGTAPAGNPIRRDND
jgi:hypothetical protein